MIYIKTILNEIQIFGKWKQIFELFKDIDMICKMFDITVNDIVICNEMSQFTILHSYPEYDIDSDSDSNGDKDKNKIDNDNDKVNDNNRVNDIKVYRLYYRCRSFKTYINSKSFFMHDNGTFEHIWSIKRVHEYIKKVKTK